MQSFNGHLFPTRNKFKCLKCLIRALNVISYCDLWTSHLLTRRSVFQSLSCSCPIGSSEFSGMSDFRYNHALRERHDPTCVQRIDPKKLPINSLLQKTLKKKNNIKNIREIIAKNLTYILSGKSLETP